MTQPLRIGTRGSRLALWQAAYVADLLRSLAAPRLVELVEIRTTGDRVHGASLAQIGGQGVFTKEIQEAVADGRADVAVHSLKDLPTLPVPGITLAAVPPRAPANDVFVSDRHESFDALPHGARLASGSARRRAQILYRRADLVVEDVRGNVDTRLQKLRERQLDGLILAQAGLERLKLQHRITESLGGWMLPAVGQGALGLEARTGDEQTLSLLGRLNHVPSWQAVSAERAFLRELGGGCSLPIAAHCVLLDGRVHLAGAVFQLAGERRVGGEATGPADEGETVGRRLAQKLLQQGARELLD